MGTLFRLIISAIFLLSFTSSCVVGVGLRSSYRAEVFDSQSFVPSALKRTVLVRLICSVPSKSIVFENGTLTIKDVVVKRQAAGSGVILKSYVNSSYILTAAHVVAPLKRYKCDMAVFKYSDRCLKHPIPAELVKADYEADLAVVGVKTSLGVNTKVAWVSHVGEPVTVVGFPSSYSNVRIKKYGLVESASVTTGVVASILYKDGTPYDLRLTAVAYFGNSGGPVFNACGEVLGVVAYFYGVNTGDGGAIAYHAAFFAVAHSRIATFFNKMGLNHLLN